MQCHERPAAAAEVCSSRCLATELDTEPQTHRSSCLLQSLAADSRNQRAVLQEELRRRNRKPQHIPKAAQRNAI